jgi:hypothetical protein
LFSTGNYLPHSLDIEGLIGNPAAMAESTARELVPFSVEGKAKTSIAARTLGMSRR